MTARAIRKTRARCDHVQAVDRTPVCCHLAGPLDGAVTFYRWLTGSGLQAELVCAQCVARRDAGEAVEIVLICGSCRGVLEEEVGDLGGVRGAPEVRVGLEPIDVTLYETPLPWPLDAVLDVAPIEAAPACWLVVLRDGTVQRLDADRGSADRLCLVELPPAEPDRKPGGGHLARPRMHASIDGRFAAIVNDYGKRGRVFDLSTGRCTLELASSGSHANTVPFSFAFVEHGDQTVAIHRTAWNRLDATDAATGQLLCDRGPTSYQRGEQQPQHYLDYYHGRLLVCPDGRRIVDDGWVWHPVGIPTVWDVSRWLDCNVWESEDGPSRMSLAFRDYYWDHAMCWLDSERIAVGGIGEDDDWMIDGARIFTAAEAGPSSGRRRSARELGAFAGPGGCFFGDGRRLFSAGENALTIWDVDTGTLLARIDGFTPSRQHSRGRTLAQISGQRLIRWRY